MLRICFTMTSTHISCISEIEPMEDASLLSGLLKI